MPIKFQKEIKMNFLSTDTILISCLEVDIKILKYDF